MVEYAEGWLEACGNQCAGSGGTDDGVAVVEQGVEKGFAHGVALVALQVAIREACLPVDAGGACLVVLGITGFHVCGEGFQSGFDGGAKSICLRHGSLPGRSLSMPACGRGGLLPSEPSSLEPARYA